MPKNYKWLSTCEVRQPGEWTQKLAINKAVAMACGEYVVKNDIDHVFTPEAIAAADQFKGEMMLFHRRAGVLTESLEIQPIDHPVHSPVDDIWAMKRSLFLSLGGYPEEVTRRYGGAGKCFWNYSRKPEAQPPDGALIYVAPDIHEKYHGLMRVA